MGDYYLAPAWNELTGSDANDCSRRVDLSVNQARTEIIVGDQEGSSGQLAARRKGIVL